MFFDAVINDAVTPLFNGTPEEVVQWLEDRENIRPYRVCVGASMQLVEASEYLALHGSDKV